MNYTITNDALHASDDEHNSWCCLLYMIPHCCLQGLGTGLKSHQLYFKPLYHMLVTGICLIPLLDIHKEY
jgi:hypothetical protein